MRGVLRRHQPRTYTTFLLPPSSLPALSAGCINASSDTSTSFAFQALNRARICACACVRRGALRIFMRGLPCETPSRSSFSFRRLAPSPPRPSPPSPPSDLFPAPSPFLSILPGPERPRRVTRSVTGITHDSASREPSRASERTNKNGWLQWHGICPFHVFSEEIWNGVFLLPLRHREAI